MSDICLSRPIKEREDKLNAEKEKIEGGGYDDKDENQEGKKRGKPDQRR